MSFQIPMATLGVVPDGVTARRLAQIGGPGTARSVLLQGRALNARECLRRGVVEDVLAAEELDQHLLRMVSAFASSSAYSVTRTKAMLLEQEAWDVQDLTSGMVASFLHGDVAVNARAFLERRGPRG